LVDKLVVLSAEGGSYARPFRHLLPKAEITHLPTTEGYFNPADKIDPQTTAVMFTGGHDVTPAFYGAREVHPQTISHVHRDIQEKAVYEHCRQHGIAMFGICRGSQFLAVMLGQQLHQHIEHHGLNGTHLAYPVAPDAIDAGVGPGEPAKPFPVTSTHHQAVVSPDNPVHKSFVVVLMGENHQVAAVEGWRYNRYPIAAVQYHPEYMDVESEGFQYYLDLLRVTLRMPTKTYHHLPYYWHD